MTIDLTKRSRGTEAGSCDLPVAKNEDVEFALEAADADDLEARRRAEEADRRVRDC